MSIPDNFQLDELPADWRLARLGEVSALSKESINPSAYADELFEYYSIPAFQESGEPLITPGREILSLKLLVRDGMVLFGKLNPRVPKVWRVRPGTSYRKLASTEFLAMSPVDSIDGEFFTFLCWSSHVMEVSRGLVAGSTPSRQRVDPSSFLEIPVPVPPLPEQWGIAAVLSKVWAAVDAQEEIVATLKELKAATMAKLFREGLRGEPLKQTELGEIPESWEIVRLGEVASVERGKFAHRPRNDPRFYGGTIPFIQTGDVAKYNGRIRTYTQTLNEEGLAISQVFPKGTIVLTIAANIADTGILEFDSAFPDSLVGITPDQTMDSAFLEYLFRTQKREMDRLAPKGTQKNINIQFLKPWPIPRPLLDEQRRIAEQLRCVDDRLESASARLRALKVLFSSMLQRLMTGQIRVKVDTASSGEVAIAPLRSNQGDADSVTLGKLPEAVERFVAELVRRFDPERVILFGQHAPGSPELRAEVALLVIMPFEGRSLAQAVRLEREIEHDFPLEVVVRRPQEVEDAVEKGNSLIEGILKHGRTLYVRPGAPTAERRAHEVPAEQEPRRTRKVSEDALREIVQRIVAAVAPEKIILFGSAARGEMGSDSDVDLMVVKACANRRELAGTIRQSLIGVAAGLPKDVIVVTPEELERHRDTIGLIYRPALREGRVIYAA